MRTNIGGSKSNQDIHTEAEVDNRIENVVCLSHKPWRFESYFHW